MATITKIDRAACRVIDNEALKALEVVAKKLGLTLNVKGARFDPTGGTVEVKFEFKTEGSDEGNFSRYLIFADDNFGDNTWLTAADYNAEILVKGVPYRLTGINPNKPKFRFNITRISDGKTFGYTTAGVKFALAQAKAKVKA